MAYLTGIALLAAGLSILANKKSRLSAILLGILFLLYVMILELPRVLAKPLSGNTRTIAFETLAMCAAAFVLAGILPKEGPGIGRWDGALDKLGRYLFAVCLVVFGIDHFLFLDFVASLVPFWIPWHLFCGHISPEPASLPSASASRPNGWDDWGPF